MFSVDFYDPALGPQQQPVVSASPDDRGEPDGGGGGGVKRDSKLTFDPARVKSLVVSGSDLCHCVGSFTFS